MSKASPRGSGRIGIHIGDPAGVRFVLSNLLAGDYAEVVAATGRDPKHLALDIPFNTHVAYVDGVPVAIYGCSQDAEGYHPWLLCTPGVKGHARFMLRHGKGLLRRWYYRKGPLTNVVHSKNHSHIRFIKALGCTLGETRKRGPLLEYFTEFTYVPSSTRRSTGTHI